MEQGPGPINPNPPPPPVSSWYPKATIISGNTVEVTITGDSFQKIYVYWDDATSTDFTPPTSSVQKNYSSNGTYEILVNGIDNFTDHWFYWDNWPATQTCDTCPTLQMTVP